MAVAVLPCLYFGFLMTDQAPTVPWAGRDMLSCYLLAVMLLLGELWPLRVARADGDTDQVTVSTTFALALLFSGPLVFAMAVQAGAVAISDLFARRPPLRAAFNVGQYLLAIAAARWTFALLAGVPMLAPMTSVEGRHVLPALLAGLAFFLVNNGTVGVAVALQNRRSTLAVLLGDLRVQGLTSAILIGLAPVAAVTSRTSLLMLTLIALPLVGVQRNAWIAAQRQHEALHDGLTGLPNRRLFQIRADGALGEADPDQVVGVMLLDLDHFKDVNDTLGHHAGDALLREVAARVTSEQSEEVTVARFGGDEFAVMVGPVDDPGEVEALAQLISSRLREPITFDGVRLGVQASIGIAMGRRDDTTESLLRQADIALYQAKENRGEVQVYRPETDQNTLVRLNLMADLMNGEGTPTGLELVYQPQIEAATGRVVSIEALMRWQHPVHGWIMPEVFIPLAESSGAIGTMSHNALASALRTLHRMRGAGFDLSMAVNISARVLQNLEVPVWVERLLAEHAVPADRLTIEVTESTLIADPRQAMLVLRQLRTIGVRLSIDDFGTGYSSLSYLQRLRPDDLKVDKSFVTRMLVDENDGVIVRSILDLARGLGLTVVAEGVEDAETLARLAQLGCDRAQGFYIGTPMSEVQLAAWLGARMSAGPVLAAPPASVPGQRRGPGTPPAGGAAGAATASGVATVRGAAGVGEGIA